MIYSVCYSEYAIVDSGIPFYTSGYPAGNQWIDPSTWRRFSEGKNVCTPFPLASEKPGYIKIYQKYTILYIWDLDYISYPSGWTKKLYRFETLFATPLVRQHAEPFARTALLLGILSEDEKWNPGPAFLARVYQMESSWSSGPRAIPTEIQRIWIFSSISIHEWCNSYLLKT